MANALSFNQDLGNADLCKEIYLVAHVMRVGRMIYSESSKKSSGTLGGNGLANSHLFRRPVGVAVLNISEQLLFGHNQVNGLSVANGGSSGFTTNTSSTTMWTSTSATLGEERENTIKVRFNIGHLLKCHSSFSVCENFIISSGVPR